MESDKSQYLQWVSRLGTQESRCCSSCPKANRLEIQEAPLCQFKPEGREEAGATENGQEEIPVTGVLTSLPGDSDVP